MQTQFSLHKYPYTSDISKAYLRINVDDETAGLCIFIWYVDLENLQNYVLWGRGSYSNFDHSTEENSCTIMQICYVMKDNYWPSLC